jgi:nucleoid-associated protein YgaU
VEGHGGGPGVSGSATSFDDSRRPDGRHTSRPAEPDSANPSETTDRSSDWGLSDRKSGMSREMKVGLLLILLLAGAFGYVVYRKIQNANDFPDIDGVATTHDQSSRRNRRVEPIPPTSDGSQTTSDEKRGFPHRRQDGSATTTAQREPPFGGRNDPGSGTPPGGNPFQQVSGSTPLDGSATTGDGSAGKVKLGGFPSGQGQPNTGDPFASQSSGEGANSGSATTVDSGSRSSPWELGSGNGQTTTRDTRGATPSGGDAFGSGSATTVDRGQPAADGFQSAEPTRRPRRFDKGVEAEPFDGRGRFDSRPRRHVPPTGGSEPPQGVFGGNFEPSGSATTTDTGKPIQDGSVTSRDVRGNGLQPVDDARNSRFGPYRFAGDERRHAGSATNVQAGGSDVDHPFGRDSVDSGKPLGSGGATTVERRPAGAPATLDGQDIQYGNDRPRVHVVGHGDNYWTISRKAYGAGRYFQALAEYNRHRIPDPKRMRPGMKVLVPTIEVLATRFPKLCPARHGGTRLAAHATGGRHEHGGFFRDQSGSPMFRVGKTDTLTEIAQKHLGRSSRWIQIYHMNRERIPNPNRLTIGTELHLPADASNIRVVRGGAGYR